MILTTVSHLALVLLIIGAAHARDGRKEKTFQHELQHEQRQKEEHTMHVPGPLSQNFRKIEFRKVFGTNMRHWGQNIVARAGRMVPLVPNGFLDFGVLLSLTQASSQYASWEPARWNRNEGRTAGNRPVPPSPVSNGGHWEDSYPNLPYRHAGLNRGSFHIPFNDFDGVNGKWTRHALVTGNNELAAQSVILERNCDSVNLCDDSQDGIYVGIGVRPARNGIVTFSSKFLKPFLPVITAAAGVRYLDPGTKTLGAWTYFWTRTRVEFWTEVNRALRACDQARGISNVAANSPGLVRCPLNIGGSSMGGFFAGLAAYDIAAMVDDPAAGFQRPPTSMHGTAPEVLATAHGVGRRIVRVVSFNAPKVGNPAFVLRLRALDHINMPYIRVINDGDLTPSWPLSGPLTTYPFDQGGLVLPMTNYITSEKVRGKGHANAARVQALITTQLTEICLQDELIARTECHTHDCEKVGYGPRYLIKLGLHFQKHHFITKKLVPHLVELLTRLNARMLGVAPANTCHSQVNAMVPAERAALLGVWQAHAWFGQGPTNLGPKMFRGCHANVGQRHCMNAVAPPAAYAPPIPNPNPKQFGW